MKKFPIENRIDQKTFIEYALERLKEVKQDQQYLSLNLEKLSETTVADSPEPKIAFTPIALWKMQTLVNGSTKELAWHGFVYEKNGYYVISDISVYPQVVTAATADADPEKYPEWILAFKEKINTIRFQGHSHVNMGVSPSVTDTTYYSDLVNQVQDFYIFMILNKSGAVHLRMYDKRCNTLYTELEYSIYHGGEFYSADVWLKYETSKITDYVYRAPATAPLAMRSGKEVTQGQLALAYDHYYDH